MGISANKTHTYAQAGEYSVEITGTFPKIEFVSKIQLIDVEQWGTTKWQSMEKSFKICSNLGTITATDTPNLSNVTDMSWMFMFANSFDGDLSNWDVSSVTNMSLTFNHSSSFNGDLSNWDVSSVTDMNNMFAGASSFAGDLSNWNVSKVTDMSNMFLSVNSFNSDISNWNVSAVINMSGIFANVSSFKGDVSNWDVSSVTNISNMFQNAVSFNGDLSKWDVSSVTNMSNMFMGASIFDGDISNWNVSNVINMSHLFNDASSFNGDISKWDVSTVIYMSNMFMGASSFNGDLSNWDVSSVTAMYFMFDGASLFNGDLSNWDVSSVAAMYFMFDGASSFDKDISNWDVAKVRNMEGMFAGVTLSTENYDAILTEWSKLALTSKVTFDGGSSTYCNSESARQKMIDDFGWNITDGGKDMNCSLSTDAFIIKWKIESNDLDLTIPVSADYTYNYDINWGDGATDVGVAGNKTHTYAQAGDYSVKITRAFPKIEFREKLQLVDVEQWGTTIWESMEFSFYGCENMQMSAVDIPNLSNVTTMKGMFRNVNSIGQSIGDWDVSNVSDLSEMFAEVSSFNQDISKWNISNATDISYMFYSAESFNQDIGGWDVSKVTNMQALFSAANAFNQDIGNWDVSNVVNMGFMFSWAYAFNQNIGDWDVSNVVRMGLMFYEAHSFNQDLGGWNVGKVENMYTMFSRAKSFNQDIGSWNVSNVTNMGLMFNRATSFNQNIGNWDVSNAINMENMFDYVTLSTENYDAILEGWSKLSLKSNTIFSGGNSKYCSSEVARQKMIDDFGWTITDGGKDCSTQRTYIPDDNFEQALIDLGYDDVLDDYVLTANISGVTTLDVSNKNINDLTGIAGFKNLKRVKVDNNLLPSAELDALVNLLAGQPTDNGELFIANNIGSLTLSSQPAYDNLISRGWTIDVAAPVVPGPEINVTGIGQSIPNGNAPIISDDTDFGKVAIGTPITHTFTIENLGDSDLTLSFVGKVTGNSYKLVPQFIFGDVVTSGGFTTIDITFTSTGQGVELGQFRINSDDSDEDPYLVNLTAEGITASSGTIDVQGNGIFIVNGDTTPDVADDTNLGSVLINATKTTTYSIYNNHATENLTVSSIALAFGVNEFQMGTISETLPFDIAPGGNITFDVDFTPIAEVAYQSSIQINNSETSQNPFQYSIVGQGADIVVSGDIMITQYYEGVTDSKWIEIKNISGAVISAGTYFLALYNDTDIPNIDSQGPSASESIPEMAIDEVLLFRNANASTPGTGNIGSSTQIVTTVCNFDGDDVILISSTNDILCYANRQDIIGTVPSTVWGNERSYVRGGNYEIPEANFNSNHWILLSVGADVDLAIANTNIALGTQDVDIAVWNGVWSNSILPDKTRNVKIQTDYNANDGTFTAGNLTINSNLNFNNGTTNSIVVYGDLVINGTFTIGNQESLVMYNGISGNISAGVGSISGIINKLENSTNRNDQYDITYWSSPVENANITTVFSGVSSNRIFYYDQLQTSTTDPSDPTYYDVWVGASGTMIEGLGYAADGPTGTTGIHGISFTGKPNNGPVSIELKGHIGDGEAFNDFNLVGNPYPSAIDIVKFLNFNDNINKTIYLWTHFTPFPGNDYVQSDYATRNLTGGTSPSGTTPEINIGSGQGFMVAAINNGFVNFANYLRMVDANDQFFKSDDNKKKEIKNEKDRIWLKIGTDQGGMNRLLIGFVEKATEGLDNGYDSRGILGVNTIDFYSDINGNNYVIQGLPTYTGDETVQLGFNTKVAPRNMTISIDKMEGVLNDVDIYLVDNLLNITHDLKDSDYTFEQSITGEFPNRFSLQFKGKALDVDDEIFAKNEFVISNDLDSFKIRSEKEVKEIKVFDLLGRLIIQKQPNKKSFNLSTGSVKNGTVLIVKATLENGTVVSKKTIKY